MSEIEIAGKEHESESEEDRLQHLLDLAKKLGISEPDDITAFAVAWDTKPYPTYALMSDVAVKLKA